MVRVRTRPFTRHKRTSDWDAGEPLGGFDVEDLSDSVVWPKYDRRGYKAILVTFYSSDHCRLGHGRLVVMYHSDPPEELAAGMISTIYPTSGETRKMRLTAMEMAISASVTVSIGELMKGVLRVILRVILPSTVTPLAAKSILPGRSKKSL